MSSMKLDTVYRQDWYNIVEQVCSQRKRKEKGGCTDLIAVKRNKRSNTCSSPSTACPEPTPGTDGLCVTPPVLIPKPVIKPLDVDHEPSTIVPELISTQPSLDVEELSPEEEIRRLHSILREKDALISELKQQRQHGQINQQAQVEQGWSKDLWDEMEIWETFD